MSDQHPNYGTSTRPLTREQWQAEGLDQVCSAETWLRQSDDKRRVMLDAWQVFRYFSPRFRRP